MLSIIKCGVSVVLLLQPALAFFPPPKNSASIKPSDLSKSGLGGFDLIAKTNKKFVESSVPAKVAVVAKKVAAAPKKVVSSPQKKVMVAKGGIKTNKATVGKNVGTVSKGTNNDEATPWFKKLF